MKRSSLEGRRLEPCLKCCMDAPASLMIQSAGADAATSGSLRFEHKVCVCDPRFQTATT